MLTLISTIATVSALVAGLLPALQIRHMVRERSAEGIAMPYLVGGLVNGAIWTVYGLALGNSALILSSVLGVATGIAMLSVAAVFRTRGVPVEPPSVHLMASVVAADPAIAAELTALVAEKKAVRRSEADTLILRPRLAVANA